MSTFGPCCRKRLEFFAALCIVASLLAGCGKKEGVAFSPRPASARAPAPASAAEKLRPPAPAPADEKLPPPAPPPSQYPTLAVDRIIEEMNWGNIAFNAPQSIELKDTAQIQLLLRLEQSFADLRDAVKFAGEKEGARIRVSNRMEAHLTGPSFQITAITREDQVITSKGVTEWNWEIKPTTAGRHYLHLTLCARFNVDDTSTQRCIRTFDKTIEVHVTLGQQALEFVGKNWQWIWAAILIPVVGWLWKKWRQSKKEKPDS